VPTVSQKIFGKDQGLGGVNGTMQQTERASTGFVDLMSALGPEERKGLTAVLRKPNTFLAEDVTDVVAILQILKKQRDNTGLSAGHFAGRRRKFYDTAKK
jgi:hypothetical protein